MIQNIIQNIPISACSHYFLNKHLPIVLVNYVSRFTYNTDVIVSLPHMK